MMHDQFRTLNVIGSTNVNTIDLTAISRKSWNNQGERTLTPPTLVVRLIDQGDIRKNLAGLLYKMARHRHVCVLPTF